METLAPLLFHFALILYVTGACLAVLQIPWKEHVRPWMAPWTVQLGWICQSAYVGVYCHLAERHDFSSPFEILLLASWAGALMYLIVAWVYRVRVLGAFAMPLIAALAVAGRFASTEGQGLPSGVGAGFLFAVHVLAAIIAYAAFFTAFVAGVMFLAQEGQLKRRRFGPLWSALPSLETLERTLARSLLAGMVLFTIAIGVGANRAGVTQALGPQWIAEPKSVLTLVTWSFFAVLGAVRALNLIRGRRAAYGAIAGFLLVVATSLVAHGFSAGA